MAKPVRLRLSRRKGFDLQTHSRSVNGLPAINVARPSKWGNPYQAGKDGQGDRAYLVDLFRAYLNRPEQTSLVDAIRHELRGKNLACWCPCDGKPCHADVLLALANDPEREENRQ
ncbi:DUF4326 domain-containing protein [Nitratireductor luteus]|uniref:DUF4326 domain-containing protein n=1 Tax=Nitratireductor luteus TaxID=2976980 RepID=UPI0022404BC6|nr:DUF4326 domain-containing protein [Nitratireductor luteus]